MAFFDRNAIRKHAIQIIRPTSSSGSNVTPLNPRVDGGREITGKAKTLWSCVHITRNEQSTRCIDQFINLCFLWKSARDHFDCRIDGDDDYRDLILWWHNNYYYWYYYTERFCIHIEWYVWRSEGCRKRKDVRSDVESSDHRISISMITY